MRHVLRWIAAIGTVALASLFWATPAQASGDTQAFVLNFGQQHGYVLLPVGGYHIFVGAGTDMNAPEPFYLDMSHLSGQVDYQLPSSCSPSGAVAVCDGGGNEIVLKPVAGAKAGPAGSVQVRAQYNDDNMANNTATLDIDIQAGAYSVPVATVNQPSGKVGSVVALTLTVRNPGPNTIDSVLLENIGVPEGTSLTTNTCSATQSSSGCGWHDMPVGSSFTETLNLRIDSCNNGGNYGSYTLYYNGNNSTVVSAGLRIACSASGSGSGSGSGTGSGTGSGSATGSGSGSVGGQGTGSSGTDQAAPAITTGATALPTDEPTAAASAVASQPTVALAATSRPATLSLAGASSIPFWRRGPFTVGIASGVVLAAAGGWWLRRRRLATTLLTDGPALDGVSSTDSASSPDGTSSMDSAASTDRAASTDSPASTDSAASTETTGA